jgi:hypothetical protein
VLDVGSEGRGKEGGERKREREREREGDDDGHAEGVCHVLKGGRREWMERLGGGLASD